MHSLMSHGLSHDLDGILIEQDVASCPPLGGLPPCTFPLAASHDHPSPSPSPPSTPVFETLYLIITFGHDVPELAAKIDPPDDYYRIRCGRQGRSCN